MPSIEIVSLTLILAFVTEWADSISVAVEFLSWSLPPAPLSTPEPSQVSAEILPQLKHNVGCIRHRIGKNLRVPLQGIVRISSDPVLKPTALLESW